MSEARIAIPSHGHFAAMGYKFRCRLESKRRGIFRKQLFHRAVIEKHFMGWEDFFSGRWHTERRAAIADGTLLLDAIEGPPQGEYLARAPEQEKAP